MADYPEGTLKVWHIPQVPMEPFEIVPVGSLVEAVHLIDVLGFYDLFQYAHNVKPDYSNMGGIMVMEDGEWVDVEESDIEEVMGTYTERNYTV